MFFLLGFLWSNVVDFLRSHAKIYYIQRFLYIIQRYFTCFTTTLGIFFHFFSFFFLAEVSSSYYAFDVNNSSKSNNYWGQYLSRGHTRYETGRIKAQDQGWEVRLLIWDFIGCCSYHVPYTRKRPIQTNQWWCLWYHVK